MMIKLRDKNLKRVDFINSVDSDKIWKKQLTISEIKELLGDLIEQLTHYDYSLDNDFFMNGRRRYCKETIEKLMSKDNKNKNDILESLFTFWEFVGDEYAGTLYSASEELEIPVQKLEVMDQDYRKRGIICSQEKDIIIDLINTIEDGIKEMSEE